MEYFISAITMGLCLSLMSLGIYISMKIFNIPDITTDGSYTLGAVITAIVLQGNHSFFIAVPLVLICGALAGAITGFIHTRLKIDALLSGILVMTALYSVNLSLMGRSNIPLINTSSIFNIISISSGYDQLIIAAIMVVLFAGFIVYLLKTDFGIAMRATGNSITMSKALGVNIHSMRIKGLAIANALTALSGYMIAQYQGFTDINMGIGIVITGLGSVLMADAMIKTFQIKSLAVQVLLVIIGSIVFRLVLAVTLLMGVDPNLLKLITALFVLMIVASSAVKLRRI